MVESERVALMPLSESSAVTLGARVGASQRFSHFIVGDGPRQPCAGMRLAGRSTGFPRRADSETVHRQPVLAATLDRVTPGRRIATGIRAIDTMLPVGEGQRIGIFAASGVRQ